MPKNISIKDLGRRAYREVWDMQHALFSALQNDDSASETILLVEHEPVYTLGFHGDEHNMLLSEKRLSEIGTECIRIERGGDITFHGPGQLVAYPILNLRRHGLGIRKYVNILEESVIRTCADFGIKADRDPSAPGVWLDVATPLQRKICALGVKCSHFVTMHGLALNVSTDLRYFTYINPCGFADKGVTSLSAETTAQVNMSEVKARLTRHLLFLL